MEPMELTLFILSLVIGYVMGSINPGYIFGRLKGIDIRKVGSKNAGTSNTYHILGKYYAIPTALYDFFKSLLASVIAIYGLGLNYFLAQFSGLLAVIGHILPFYMKFKGGKGVASSIGMVPYYVSMYVPIDLNMIFVVIYTLIIAFIFVYITKLFSMIALIMFPIMQIAAFILYPYNIFNIFFLIVNIHILSFVVYSAFKYKKFPLKDKIFKSDWIWMAFRLLSLIFLLFIYDKVIILSIVSVFMVGFICVDLFRIFHLKSDEAIPDSKIKGTRKFSSISIYLVAYFITVLVFPESIAIVSIVFLIFGDIFEKIFGLGFGKRKIFDKTIRGTLATLGSMCLSGYILYISLGISLLIIIIGGLSATLTKLFTLEMNDNFTVPIISGSIIVLVTLLF